MTNFNVFIISIFLAFQVNAYVIECKEESIISIKCNMYLSEKDHTLVGYVEIGKESPMEDEIIIDYLHIGEKFRKRGLSFLLLRVGIISTEAYWQFNKISLTDASSVRLQTGKYFYEPFGFKCKANAYLNTVFCSINRRDFLSKKENEERWQKYKYLITKFSLSGKTNNRK